MHHSAHRPPRSARPFPLLPIPSSPLSPSLPLPPLSAHANIFLQVHTPLTTYFILFSRFPGFQVRLNPLHVYPAPVLVVARVGGITPISRHVTVP